MLNFVDMQPEEIMNIDLESLSSDELRSLHYFIWAFYTDEVELQKWRQEKLDPMVLKLPVEANLEDDDLDDDEDEIFQ